MFLLSIATVTGAMTVPASADPAPKTVQETVIVNCFFDPQVRPSEIILTCADGANSLVRLSWTRWEKETATGRGMQQINDCMPSCAEGTFHTYPVQIKLSQPEPLPHHPGVDRFTTLTLRYTGTRPPGQPCQVTGDIP